MGDFFHGWRRKAGCVTLVLACLFAAGWVRSFSVRDTFNWRGGSTHIHFVGSNWGRLKWDRLEESSQFQITFNKSYEKSMAIADATRSMFASGIVEWNWRVGGFEFGKVIVPTPNATKTVTVWEFPYWSIVLPLTLLSAWLLLSPPASQP